MTDIHGNCEQCIQETAPNEASVRVVDGRKLCEDHALLAEKRFDEYADRHPHMAQLVAAAKRMDAVIEGSKRPNASDRERPFSRNVIPPFALVVLSYAWKGHL